MLMTYWDKPKMTSRSATDHNTTAVARPRDTTTTQAEDEDAPANINVVLSTAARQQQHGQHQLMSTLPPRPTQQLRGRQANLQKISCCWPIKSWPHIMCP